MSSDRGLPVLAIFVGGKATRMGGRPKGLLSIAAQGPSIVAHQLSLAAQLGLVAAFVGAADPYHDAFPSVPIIEDLPAGIGPLGGLHGVLSAHRERSVIAIACDMPHLTLSLLSRLCREAPEAVLLASRDESGRWDPLCARYHAPRVLPVLTQALDEGVRSFQALFARLTVSELLLTGSERKQLVDWDTPEDVER